jgi:hypothetical protein
MIFFPCPDDYNTRVTGIPVDRAWWATENERNWAEWAAATVGLPKSSVGRYYSLIKYEKVGELVDRWVQHAFGRETFVISHWSNMC